MFSVSFKAYAALKWCKKTECVSCNLLTDISKLSWSHSDSVLAQKERCPQLTLRNNQTKCCPGMTSSIILTAVRRGRSMRKSSVWGISSSYLRRPLICRGGISRWGEAKRHPEERHRWPQWQQRQATSWRPSKILSDCSHRQEQAKMYKDLIIIIIL